MSNFSADIDVNLIPNSSQLDAELEKKRDIEVAVKADLSEYKKQVGIMAEAQKQAALGTGRATIDAQNKIAKQAQLNANALKQSIQKAVSESGVESLQRLVDKTFKSTSDDVSRMALLTSAKVADAIEEKQRKLSESALRESQRVAKQQEIATQKRLALEQRENQRAIENRLKAAIQADNQYAAHRIKELKATSDAEQKLQHKYAQSYLGVSSRADKRVTDSSSRAALEKSQRESRRRIAEVQTAVNSAKEQALFRAYANSEKDVWGYKGKIAGAKNPDSAKTNELRRQLVEAEARRNSAKSEFAEFRKNTIGQSDFSASQKSAIEQIRLRGASNASLASSALIEAKAEKDRAKAISEIEKTQSNIGKIRKDAIGAGGEESRVLRQNADEMERRLESKKQSLKLSKQESSELTKQRQSVEANVSAYNQQYSARQADRQNAKAMQSLVDKDISLGDQMYGTRNASQYEKLAAERKSVQRQIGELSSSAGLTDGDNQRIIDSYAKAKTRADVRLAKDSAKAQESYAKSLQDMRMDYAREEVNYRTKADKTRSAQEAQYYTNRAEQASRRRKDIENGSIRFNSEENGAVDNVFSNYAKAKNEDVFRQTSDAYDRYAKEQQSRRINLFNDELNWRKKAAFSEGAAERDYALKQAEEISLKRRAFDKETAKIFTDGENEAFENVKRNAAMETGFEYSKHRDKAIRDAQKAFDDFNNYGEQNTRAKKWNSENYGKVKEKYQNAVESGDPIDLNDARSEDRKFRTYNVSKGLTGKTLFGNMKDYFTNMAKMITPALVMTAAVKTGKDMVEAVSGIDAAMTELYKVTDNSAAEYAEFRDKTRSSSFEIGTTQKDLINSTADFARLGYSLKDASVLGKNANIYANVGDMDSDTATKFMVATMKGFNKSAEESGHIVDAFNEVGNEFAIDSQGLGNALTRGGAALKAGGNTLEQSIGLVTAANDAIQNPDTVGNMLKTISMRLRGATASDLEAAGIDAEGMPNSAKNVKDIMKSLAGVDIMKDDKTYKSTYESMKELAGKWDKLPDVTKAAITEAVAGKRGGSVMESLMSNFKDAIDATRVAENSEGSAKKENAKYLSSIEGRRKQFRSAFESLASDVVSSDVIKGGVSLGTGAVKALDTAAQHPKTALALTATGIAFAKAAYSVKKYTDGLGGAISTSTKLNMALEYMKSDVKSAGTGVLEFVGKHKIGTAIAAVTAGIIAAQAAWDKATVTYQERSQMVTNDLNKRQNAEKQIDKINSSIEANKKSIRELGADGTVTANDRKQIESLSRQNSMLAVQKTYQEDALKRAKQSAAVNADIALKDQKAYTQDGKKRSFWTDVLDTVYRGQAAGTAGDFATMPGKQAEELSRQYSDMASKGIYVSAQDRFTKSLSDFEQARSDYMNHPTGKDFEKASEKYDKSLKSLDDQMSQYQQSIDAFTDENGDIIDGYESQYNHVRAQLNNAMKLEMGGTIKKDKNGNVLTDKNGLPQITETAEYLASQLDLIEGSDAFDKARTELEALGTQGRLTGKQIKDSFPEVAEECERAGFSVDSLAESLNKIGSGAKNSVDLVARNIESAKSQAQEFEKSVSDIASSAKEGYSTTGLTSASQGVLDNAGMSNAMMNTANGVRLDTNAYQSAKRRQYEQQHADIIDDIDSTKTSIAGLNTQIEKYQDIVTNGKNKANVKEAQERLNTLETTKSSMQEYLGQMERVRAEYEGLNSDTTQFLTSLQGGTASDTAEAVAEGVAAVKKQFDEGKVSSAQVRAFEQNWSNGDISGRSNKDIAAGFNEAYARSQQFTNKDGGFSADKFISKLKDAGDAMNAAFIDGDKHIKLTSSDLQNLGEYWDIGKSQVSEMANAVQDFGWDVEISNATKSLKDYEKEARQAEVYLNGRDNQYVGGKRLANDREVFNLDNGGEKSRKAVNDQIDRINKGRQQATTTGDNRALDELNARLVSQLELREKINRSDKERQLMAKNAPNVRDEATSGAIKNLQSWQKALEKQKVAQQAYNSGIDVDLDAVKGKANSQSSSLAQYISNNGLQPKIKLDKSATVQDIQKQLSGMKPVEVYAMLTQKDGKGRDNYANSDRGKGGASQFERYGHTESTKATQDVKGLSEVVSNIKASSADLPKLKEIANGKTLQKDVDTSAQSTKSASRPEVGQFDGVKAQKGFFSSVLGGIGDAIKGVFGYKVEADNASKSDEFELTHAKNRSELSKRGGFSNNQPHVDEEPVNLKGKVSDVDTSSVGDQAEVNAKAKVSDIDSSGVSEETTVDATAKITDVDTNDLTNETKVDATAEISNVNTEDFSNEVDINASATISDVKSDEFGNTVDIDASAHISNVDSDSFENHVDIDASAHISDVDSTSVHTEVDASANITDVENASASTQIDATANITNVNQAASDTTIDATANITNVNQATSDVTIDATANITSTKSSENVTTIDARANVIGAKASNSVTIDVAAKTVDIKGNAKGLDSIRNALNSIKTKTVSVNVKANGAGAINTLKSTLNGIKAKSVNVAANVTGTGAVNSLKSAINSVPLRRVANVSANVSGTGAVRSLVGAINSVHSKSATVSVTTVHTTVNRTVSAGAGKANGTAHLSGTAHSNGTALASGNWGTKRTEQALVGELGQELVVYGSRYYTVGDRGAEFRKIPKGAIVFNHKQTAEILKHGYVTTGGGRGKVAHANGTALASGTAYAGGSDSKSDNEIDFIDIKLKRLSNSLSDLTKLIDQYDTFLLKNANLEHSILKINQSISAQNQAYDAYMNKANSVGLAEPWASKVRDGSISIENVASEDIRNKIQKYQDWYEKALAVKDTISDLNKQLKEISQAKFANIQDDYKVFTDCAEAIYDLYDAQNKLNTAKTGYSSLNALSIMAGQMNSKIPRLRAEVTELQNEERRQLASHEIEKYSKDYYKLETQIQSVAKDLAQAETMLAEVNSSIRELNWSKFTDSTARIEAVNTELEKTESLISDFDGFDKDGKIDNIGFTQMGLATSRMDEARKSVAEYNKALETLRIERDKGIISQKVYNDEMAKNRSGLLGAVNDIKQAEKSVVSFIKNGIEAETKAFKELIDARKEDLSKQKEERSFNRDVTKQRKEIDKINAQIDALSGDTTQAANVQRHKLQSQLKDAQESLNEKLEDRESALKSDSYDDAYDEFTKRQDEYDKKLDTDISFRNKEINGMLDNTEKHHEAVYSQLNSLADQYGFTLDQEVVQPWKNAKAALDEYRNAVNSQKSSTAISTSGYKQEDKSSIRTIYGEKRNSQNSSKGDYRNTLFNADYYAAHNKDVARDKYYGQNANTLYEHFVQHGMAEGRIGSPVFDPKYYKAQYKDLAKAFGNDWKKYYEHFITYGIREGRKGSGAFDVQKYATNTDLQRSFGDDLTKYYNHYNQSGIYENRIGSPERIKRSVKTGATTSSPSGNNYHVNGAWNFRQTPNGKIIAVVTNQTLASDGQTQGDWIHLKYGNTWGWIYKKGLSRAAHGSHNTSNGLYLTDEQGLGSEAIITKAGVLRQMNAGDMVFNAKQKEMLWKLSKMELPKIVGRENTSSVIAAMAKNSGTSNINVTNKYDSLLTVNGNVDKDTLPSLEEILKQASEYTKKDMVDTFRKIGIR